MVVGACRRVQFTLLQDPRVFGACTRRPSFRSISTSSSRRFGVWLHPKDTHWASQRLCVQSQSICEQWPGHSSWAFSWELEPSDWRSVSAADRSCSESCSLLGMEFFFGRPFGLVGDSRPPPCNTCRLNISRKKSVQLQTVMQVILNRRVT